MVLKKSNIESLSNGSCSKAFLSNCSVKVSLFWLENSQNSNTEFFRNKLWQLFLTHGRFATHWTVGARQSQTEQERESERAGEE